MSRPRELLERWREPADRVDEIWTRVDEGQMGALQRVIRSVTRVAQRALRECERDRPALLELGADWQWQATRDLASTGDVRGKSSSDVEALLDVFLPTTILFPTQKPREAAWTREHIDVSGTFCCWVSCKCVRGDTRGVDGFTLILPPVRADEVQRRQLWIEERLIDPPTRAEHPYWRLGSWNAWRLESLGWAERLVLAGLTATACTATVVLGPPALVPRVGFVLQAAQRLERTIVVIDPQTVPGLQAQLQGARPRTQLRTRGSDFLFE